MLVQADIGETIKVRASADGTNATGSVMSGETTIVEKRMDQVLRQPQL